jgi:HD-GYP domain-containing protein (c-di-GMP phosphodiesterase class II)
LGDVNVRAWVKTRAHVYAIVVAAVAVAILVINLPEFVSTLKQDPRGVAIWFTLLTVAGVLTYVALKGGGAVTGTAVVNFAIIITYGGPVAAWLGALEMLFLTKVLLRFNPVRALFNMSQMAISLALAGMVYEAFGGTRLALTDWSLRVGLSSLLPLVLCHLTYFFTNTGLVTVWSSLTQERSALRTWKACYLWMLPQSFAAPVVGVLMAYVYVRLSALLMVIFFLWLVYYARSSKINLELQNSQRGTVAALATTVDSSTPFLEGESERVAGLAVELGRRIGLSGWRMQALEYAALLHDIGYLAVGKRTLAKGACLSAQEWDQVRRHAEIGASIIARVRALSRVSEIVRAHHERPDGRGYPRGLKRVEIPREARILKVADAFVAMTTDRPYRQALTITQAIKKIRDGAGTHFDVQAVRGLLELHSASALGQYASSMQEAA